MSRTQPEARRGDVGHCPVCGSEVYSEAYHCPQCQSDFCYQCRARLFDEDVQLQCTNLECSYYGKTVCAVCNPEHEREEDPSVYYEPVDGIWPLIVLAGLVGVFVLWAFMTFTAAVLVSLLLAVGGGAALQRVGVSVLGKQRKVEYRQRSIEHHCLSCGSATRRLRVAD